MASKDNLQPVRREPLYDQVARRLREFINDENLQPGDRLMSERELARRLGVSRSPIRQALMALRTMGLLEVRHGDGVYLLARSPEEVVSTLALEVLESRNDLPTIWEVRQPLESQAAGLAARRRSGAELRRMSEALDAMSDAIRSGDEAVLPDRHFHEAIHVAAHNPLLLQLLQQLASQLDRASQESLSQPGQPSRSLEQHRHILDAIERRDEDSARISMQHHLIATSDVRFVRKPD